MVEDDEEVREGEEYPQKDPRSFSTNREQGEE